MFSLALRQLAYDKLRSLLTVLAIGCAIAVILVLRGFEQGLYVQSEGVVLHRNAPLFAVQSGVANFFVVRSSLPQLTRQAVEAVPGVAVAHPVTGLWIIYGPDGNKMPLFLMVHDAQGVGGPTRIIAGNNVRDGRDIVVDIGFAKKFGLKPGDPLVISEFEFRITGITEEDSALFAPLAFVTYDGIIDFFLESEVVPDITTFPLVSFLLIELQQGVQADSVAQAIENRVPEVDVYSAQQLAQNDRVVGEELFGPIMGVLVGLSYTIGLLIIGLIIYSDVSSRSRSFGVMKALGFHLSHIINSVAIQSCILVVIAFPLGVLLAQTTASIIEYQMPVYMVHVLDPVGLWYAFIGMVVITGVGSLLPLRMIARIDPLLAFQVE